MALPSNGTISMSQMRTEFGYSGQVSMSQFYNNRYTCRDPRSYAMSSWYGYVHAACCPAYGTYITSYCSGCNLYYRYADGSCGYYDVYQGCSAASCGAGCCLTDVTINWFVPYNLSCYQNDTFAASASTTVDTTVTVDITWYGDLGGVVYGTVYIYSGGNCNTTSIYTGGSINCYSENISYSTAAISPSNTSTQNYITGTYGSPGFSPC